MITAFLTNIKYILYAVLAIMALWLCYKYPITRKAILIIAVCTFVATSCMMGSRVIEYYTISGQTYGTVSSVFNDRKTEYEKTGELTFEFSKFGLQSTTLEGQFQARVTDPHKIDIDLTNNDWSIYVNDTLLSNISTSGSALSGELTYLFRDTNNTPITVDTLFISIGFEDNATDIVVTTNGGDIAVNLWNTYLNKNGFKLELKQTEPHSVDKVITITDDLNSYTIKDSAIDELNLYINKALFDSYGFDKSVTIKFRKYSTINAGFGSSLLSWTDDVLTLEMELKKELTDYYRFTLTDYPSTDYSCFFLNFKLSNDNLYAVCDFETTHSFSVGTKQINVYLNQFVFYNLDGTEIV